MSKKNEKQFVISEQDKASAIIKLGAAIMSLGPASEDDEYGLAALLRSDIESVYTMLKTAKELK